jgi:hypothetical protein
VTEPAVTLDDAGKQIEEAAQVEIVGVDALAVVAAGDQVVDRAGMGDPKRTSDRTTLGA